MNIAKDFTELVGNTPLLEIKRYSEAEGVEAKLIVKIESFNPMSSVKDRVAVEMILEAEEKGLIGKGTTIIEPTSGNTGIGLAAVAASRGYHIILTMPETMSVERCNLLKALGAEIVLTDGKRGMKGAIERAEALVEEIENAFMPAQFDNKANPMAHRRTTAKEILRDTENHVDVFVAGIGTGGTITGVGETLKLANPSVKIIGVEPKSSPFLTEGIVGPHNIQGIGAGFKPTILNKAIIDEILTVTDEEAIEATRKIAKTEGLLVGISSGAAIYAATLLAKRQAYAGKHIVIMLPDTGERYLSTGLYD